MKELQLELISEMESFTATMTDGASKDHSYAQDLKSRLPVSEEEAQKAYALRETQAQAHRDESLQEAQALFDSVIPEAEAQRVNLLNDAQESYRQALAILDADEEAQNSQAQKAMEDEARALVKSWTSKRSSARTQWRKLASSQLKAALASREKIATVRQSAILQAHEAWESAMGETARGEETQLDHLAIIAEGKTIEASGLFGEALSVQALKTARELEDHVRSVSGDHVRIGEILSRSPVPHTETLRSPLEMIRSDEEIRTKALADWGQEISALSGRTKERISQILAQHRQKAEQILIMMSQEIQEAREYEEQGRDAIHREVQARRDAANQGLFSDLAQADLKRDAALKSMDEEERSRSESLEQEMAGDPPPLESLAAIFSRHEADTTVGTESFGALRSEAARKLSAEQSQAEARYHMEIKTAEQDLEASRQQAIASYREEERDAWGNYQETLAALNTELEEKLGAGEG